MSAVPIKKPTKASYFKPSGNHGLAKPNFKPKPTPPKPSGNHGLAKPQNTPKQAPSSKPAGEISKDTFERSKPETNTNDSSSGNSINKLFQAWDADGGCFGNGGWEFSNHPPKLGG